MRKVWLVGVVWLLLVGVARSAPLPVKLGQRAIERHEQRGVALGHFDYFRVSNCHHRPRPRTVRCVVDEWQRVEGYDPLRTRYYDFRAIRRHDGVVLSIFGLCMPFHKACA